MGTHPIFESDFDCLTEKLIHWNRQSVNYTMASCTLQVIEKAVRIQRFAIATFDTNQEYFPDAIERLARKNANGQYEMADIYETTIDLIMTENNKIPHFLPGVSKATIDFSEQDDQVILGIREGSVQAFWKHTDGRRQIIEDLEAQAEFVNVKVRENPSSKIQSVIEIQWMFVDDSAAGKHFEFEFKFLTKIKPEFTWCFPNENYKMMENDAQFLGDVANDRISVTENQQFSFNETGNLELSLHGKEDYIDENNGRAGRLHSEAKLNENFELTSAEFHVKTYYNALNKKNPDPDKIYCIVSADSLNLGIRCLLLSLSEEPTVGQLRSLVDCKNQHEDLCLMTKENQRRYNPKKKLRPDSHILM